MSMHPALTAALADQHRRDLVTGAEMHRIAHASRPAPARPMRITLQLIAAARRPVTLLALPLIVACIAATCSCSSNSGSAVGAPIPATAVATGPADPTSPIDTSASAAAGLLAYVPASLQSSCTDTGGTTGHFPAQISGYTDSLACDTGSVSEIDEVDYYQYASTSDMQSAYGTASDGAFLPGGCASGGEEDGTWSTGGAAIGDISCPESTPVALVWDDPNTNIIAVIKADYASPSESYDWWQSNGASIDGSSAGATSS